VINASFTHPGKDVLVNDQPFIIDSFDQSDTDLAGMSGGESGVVTNVDVGETGRVSKSWWTLNDYSIAPPTTTLNQHAATLLRTMPYQVVLPTNGVLTLSTEHINVLPTSHAGTIKSFISSGSGKSHVLIVADGNILGPLTLTGNAYNTGGSAKSLLILEGGADFSQQCGMEVAKSFSCILLNNNNFAVSILPRTGLNLTALGLSRFLRGAGSGGSDSTGNQWQRCAGE
jgi:hypothetical protein